MAVFDEVSPSRKPVSMFRLVWLAPDEMEVDHLVIARNAEEARRISAGELRDAVGDDFDYWSLRMAS